MCSGVREQDWSQHACASYGILEKSLLYLNLSITLTLLTGEGSFLLS